MRNKFLFSSVNILILIFISLSLVYFETNGKADHSPTTGTTIRVSKASDGTQGNHNSHSISISADARYMAYESVSDNLIHNDTNKTWDVFVFDSQTGETSRVSVDSNGIEGNGPSGSAAISANGRFITFSSVADNLVPGDTNSQEDIFVFDRQTAQTTCVSIASNGEQGNQGSRNPSISAEGRYVTFYSRATNLVPDDTNNQLDVFVHDRQTGQTTRVSESSAGIQGNDDSWMSAISDDGNFIVFQSYATNLVDNDTNNSCDMNYDGQYTENCPDIFIHDRQSGHTSLISVATDGTQGNGKSWFPSESALSADNRYVVYSSEASNLVLDDTNGWEDVFIFDRQTNTTTRISVASDGSESNRNSRNAHISDDGRFVTYDSFASNLISNDTNDQGDVFIHDRETLTTSRVSISSDGSQGNDRSCCPGISSNGRYIVFGSDANNLVADDTNEWGDVFRHDQGLESITYSISGQVNDRSGNPLPDITVWLGFPENTLTNNDGQFVFSGLSEGLYNIRPSKDGFHFSPEIITVEVPPSASEINFTGFSPEDCALTDDTDGDALEDGWEMCGYDHDKDGVIDVDLPKMGANYLHKDIFVEIDYMEAGPDETESHQPKPAAIATIVNSFDNAPIMNEDGTEGIHLHVDFGDNAPLTWGHDETWGNLSRSDELTHIERMGTCIGDEFLWEAFNVIKNAMFEIPRQNVFHYNVWGHQLCPERPRVAGISRGSDINGASDFILGLGALDSNPGTVYEQAGIFMHELGHNLGLQHGGDNGVNFKPNYLSVMNYLFTANGLITTDLSRKFDYARWELPNLNEQYLNETVGIQFPVDEGITYGTKWYCNYQDPKENGRIAINANRVDWNCDWDDDDTLLERDINRDDAISNLASFNDWANLVYSGGLVGEYNLGEELPNVTIVEDLTQDVLDTIPEVSYLFLPNIMH